MKDKGSFLVITVKLTHLTGRNINEIKTLNKMYLHHLMNSEQYFHQENDVTL